MLTTVSMSKITPPRISESEWELMRVLWAHGPLSASEVIQHLKPSKEWHPKTAKTLLTRLVNKGAVSYKVKDRSYIYQAVFDEKVCVAAVSKSFLDRVFGGALSPMLAHFVDAERISDKQLKELEEFLTKARKGR
jgi:BlaI family penicillinase repressor